MNLKGSSTDERNVGLAGLLKVKPIFNLTKLKTLVIRASSSIFFYLVDFGHKEVHPG